MKKRDWPQVIRHAGAFWTATRKTGRNVKTGLSAAEFEYVHGATSEAERVWLLSTGLVVVE